MTNAVFGISVRVSFQALLPFLFPKFVILRKNYEMAEDRKFIRMSDYDYVLPPERIALYPSSKRDGSRLLRYLAGMIDDHSFTELPEMLPSNSLMVFNDTRVIHARLYFQKPTGASIEIFCLEPYSPADYELAFQQTGHCTWKCMVGNLRRWKSELLSCPVSVEGRQGELRAEKRTVLTEGEVIVDFYWEPADVSFGEMLTAAGELPIPPYLNRPTESSDLETYQTVYSKIDGSVAAPTAGLHFTENVLRALDEKGILRRYITLHVGAGTFRPVKTEEISQHRMHAEQFRISAAFLHDLLDQGCSCTAVGTTTVRTLESLYFLGVHLLRQPNLQATDFFVDQWEPYNLTDEWKDVPTAETIHALLDWMERNDTDEIQAATRIIIVPGFNWHIVKRMVTNFHMPKSTLLLLVSAFIGNDWHSVYQYALDHGFRFLSYGDSSLLIPKTK